MKSVCIMRFFPYPHDSHVRRDAESLRDGGYDVDIIASRFKGQKLRENLDGINIYRLPIAHKRGTKVEYILHYFGFFILCFILSVLQLRKMYKVIEVDTMPDFLVFSTIIPKLLGAKIILYLFEAMPEFFAAKFNLSRNNFAVKVLKVIEKIAVRYADHVITVNESLKKLIRQRCPVKNVSVILNVPYEKLLYCSKTTLEDNQKFLLVYHGTISKRYGIQIAVRALAHIQGVADDIDLLIIGDGEYTGTLFSLINELSLMHRVHITGWLPFNEMRAMLSNGQIGLVPFIRDGYTDFMLPNKLFEYIALGIPVIAARTNSIQDYFNDASIMFFEPGNEEDLARCILELYKNSIKRRTLAENAYKIYQKYRWQNMKKVYQQVYEDLLSKK